MSSAGDARRFKKSAFSCDTCRKRKVKCGGEQPVCKRCVGRDEPCVYKLNPTLSYTERLEGRVKALEAEVQALRVQRQSSPVPSPSTAIEQSTSHLRHVFEGLKLDEKGRITYHGPTSLFHPIAGHQGSTEPADVALVREGVLPNFEGDTRARLVTNAWYQRARETESDIPALFQHLLDTHWCWVQPLFNFIYRPAFTRDIESLGPYYSHTLMNAIFMHSVRWVKNDPEVMSKLEPYEKGGIFGRHVRTLVFDEISRGDFSIPTVQTMLLLSAHECSSGNAAQAWVYSGIAFRLIDQLGICIDGQRYAGSAHLSDEDIEIRNRLFWSCYFWDKMLSLYLGRSPSLKSSAVSPPQMLNDDSAEHDLWLPHGVTLPTAIEYPPTPARSTSCFMKMCELSVILNEILIHMYDPLQQNTEAEIQACMSQEEVALDKWWRELPETLRLDPDALPSLAPPSHIVTLNCLYHTFRVLLYRPLLTQRMVQATGELDHLGKCIVSASATLSIFDLFSRTFGYRYCTMSMSYCVYIAASIFLLQLQAAPQSMADLSRLEYCLHALKRLADTNKVMSTALDTIVQALNTMGIHFEDDVSQASKLTELQPNTQSMTTAYGTEHSTAQADVRILREDAPQALSSTEERSRLLSFEPLSVSLGGIEQIAGCTRGHDSGNQETIDPSLLSTGLL